MTKYTYIFILVLFVSCKSNHSIIKEHIDIEVYIYENDGKTQASAMPEIRSHSELNAYKRRFDYLLINVSKMHIPEHSAKRKKIWEMYPDTTKLKRLYLNEFVKDKKLVNYIETTNAAIFDSTFQVTITFTKDELMEVAAKFFYCDKVFPDTTVQSHVCVGLNGISEANWSKDFTLLEAFCYESIFNDLVNDTSQIEKSYRSEKKEACFTHRATFTTFDQYLKDVRSDLFARMKNDQILKRVLVEYYEENKNNLAFKITN